VCVEEMSMLPRWDFVPSGDYILSVALLVAYFWTRDKFMYST